MRAIDFEISDVAVNAVGESYSLADLFGPLDMTSDPEYRMLLEEAESAGFDDVETYLNH